MTIRRYQEIADQIAERIYSGDYKVGSRLPAERDLADQLSVGRPILREAMIALEMSGLVEVRRGAGIYVVARESEPLRVNRFDPGISPFELIDARILIETEIAGLAATFVSDKDLLGFERCIEGMKANISKLSGYEECDREFHNLITKAARNKALSAIVESLWNLHARGKTWSQLHTIIPSDKLHSDRLDEHIAIYEALKARDPERAKQAMREHLLRAKETLIAASEELMTKREAE